MERKHQHLRLRLRLLLLLLASLSWWLWCSRGLHRNCQCTDVHMRFHTPPRTQFS